MPKVYLQRNPERLLDIGLGTGATIWFAQKWAREIDSIEINPAVYSAVTQFFFDAVTASLYTREAFQIFRQTLSEDGVLDVPPAPGNIHQLADLARSVLHQPVGQVAAGDHPQYLTVLSHRQVPDTLIRDDGHGLIQGG